MALSQLGTLCFINPYTFPAHSLTAIEIRGHLDSDNDGMSDDFENLYSLDPENEADAALDYDSDGLTNLQEFRAGTDPTDSDTDNDGILDRTDNCPLSLPVRIVGSSQYFSAMQDAYDNAMDLDSIESQYEILTGDIILDRPVAVTLEGGYDCSYSSVTGKTKVNGNVTITSGKVTIEDRRYDRAWT